MTISDSAVSPPQPPQAGDANPAQTIYLRPLTDNAYRILGVGVGVSQNEIYEAASALRRALKLDAASSSRRDCLWLGSPKRTEADVRDALGRLAVPSRRIYERLFWFYEDRTADAPAPDADTLKQIVSSIVSTENPAARHDAALLSLATALSYDAGVTRAALWSMSLALWKETVERDDFWSLLVATDLKGDFEQLATYSEVRELRRRTLRLVTTPVADIARDAVTREDYETARRALAVLRDAALPEALFNGYEQDILAPVEDLFDARLEEVFGTLRGSVEAGLWFTDKRRCCEETLSNYNHEIKPLLRRFLNLAGVRSAAARRVFEATAVALHEVAEVYREVGEMELGRRLQARALRLSPPGCAALASNEAGMEIPSEQSGDRTDEEYRRGLQEELRPQAELFSAYIETTAAKPPSPIASVMESTWAGLLLVVVGIFCGLFVGHSPGGRSYRGLPPGIDFNQNFNRRIYVSPNMNIKIPPMPDLTPYPPLRIEPPGTTRRRRQQPGTVTPKKVRRDGSNAARRANRR